MLSETVPIVASPKFHSHLTILFPKGIVQEKYNPAGFNVGININEAAGQTVPHVHIHLIPRYDGDVEVPRGGVRGVIPEKRNY